MDKNEQLIKCSNCKGEFRIAEAELEKYSRDELPQDRVGQTFELRCPHCHRLMEYHRMIRNTYPKGVKAAWTTPKVIKRGRATV